MNIKKGRGYVYGIQYHIVWCTKYRKNVLNGAVENRLKELLQKQASSHGFSIVALETDSDHIHMLIDCFPTTLYSQHHESIKRKYRPLSF